jgi:transposase InsO family protein
MRRAIGEPALNHDNDAQGRSSSCTLALRLNRLDDKRMIRLMKRDSLHLQRHTGGRPLRAHEGRVIAPVSNQSWSSDALEIGCWNGKVVRVAFAIDTHDREVMAWAAAMGGISGRMMRDLMLACVEARFGGLRTPLPVQWLADNASAFTAAETLSAASVAVDLKRADEAGEVADRMLGLAIGRVEVGDAGRLEPEVEELRERLAHTEAERHAWRIATQSCRDTTRPEAASALQSVPPHFLARSGQLSCNRNRVHSQKQLVKLTYVLIVRTCHVQDDLCNPLRFFIIFRNVSS